MLSDFEWVLGKLQEKLEWTSSVDPNWTRDWLLWCDIRAFLYILKNREGYMVMRPVHSALGAYMARNYWGTLMWYHRHGDTAWVDSGWAPGHWPDVVSLIKQTKRRYLGWCHRRNVYLIPTSELSGDKPILSQLRRYRKAGTEQHLGVVQ